ncbi:MULTISPECIES: hypothetical protein [Hallerella]|uniref:HlyD family secretion protein n=1 Tax=Hallerella TaxID=2815788 RepID=UPI00258D54B6|nr:MULTISPECIES: hypothetical protein [Hallerella]MCI6872975.1 hypothetical protein [Hallerella sp.]MDY5029211.1 hypothetical protein [Hallerella succinigenes]
MGFSKKLDELADLNSSRFHAIESHKMLIAWIFAVASIIALGYFFHGQKIVFSGIAEAAETTVSMPEAVEVVKIHVIPGQEVQAGDTLVELSRPDLAVRMNELTRELDALEGRTNLNSADIDQKVASIQSDLNIKRNTILLEIDKLSQQYEQNKAISSKLKSISTSIKTDSSNGILLSIRNLKQELKIAESNAASQIRLLRGSKGLAKSSNKTEAEALRREMDILKQQQQELTIIAKEGWVVATVEARDGEKISSYNPIITLTHKAVTLVRGYINEKVYTRIQVGDAIEVISGSGERMDGEVLGMSSRIVPYPIRLLKMVDMPLYGREVMIRVPDKNGLLLGEKVTIAEKSKMPKILEKSAIQGGQE